MIVTLTLNPSLDRTVDIGELTRGAVIRAGSARLDPGGKGVNVLYDNIANPSVLPIAFLGIGMDGRLVTAGAHAGPDVSINFSHLYHKRITIKGRPGFTESDLPDCLAAAAEGKIMPQIDRILPLSRAAEAHRMIEDNGGQGKIVLDPTLG